MIHPLRDTATALLYSQANLEEDLFVAFLPCHREERSIICCAPSPGGATHTQTSVRSPCPLPSHQHQPWAQEAAGQGDRGTCWRDEPQQHPHHPPGPSWTPTCLLGATTPSPQSWAVQRDLATAPPSPASCAAEPDAAPCPQGSGSGAIINFDLIGGNVAAEPSWPQHSYLLGSSQSPAKAAASPSWAACSRLVCVPRLRGDAG